MQANCKIDLCIEFWLLVGSNPRQHPSDLKSDMPSESMGDIVFLSFRQAKRKRVFCPIYRISVKKYQNLSNKKKNKSQFVFVIFYCFSDLLNCRI